MVNEGVLFAHEVVRDCRKFLEQCSKTRSVLLCQANLVHIKYIDFMNSQTWFIRSVFNLKFLKGNKLIPYYKARNFVVPFHRTAKWIRGHGIQLPAAHVLLRYWFAEQSLARASQSLSTRTCETSRNFWTNWNVAMRQHKARRNENIFIILDFLKTEVSCMRLQFCLMQSEQIILCIVTNTEIQTYPSIYQNTII
jgi:hypothetical protein